MRLEIDVIDGDPPKRDRVDDGKVKDFKRHLREDNKNFKNNNVDKIADQLSLMLGDVLDNVNVIAKFGDTERVSDMNYLKMVIIEGDVVGDSKESRKYIIKLIINFLDAIAEIEINDRNKSLCKFLELPIYQDWLLSEDHVQAYNDAILFFQVSKDAKTFDRKVNVRIGSQRFSVVNGWKKSELGSRVTRPHPGIKGYFNNIDFKKNQITVKGNDGKNHKVKVTSTNFDKNLMVYELFRPKIYELEIEDHYLEKSKDSELHLISCIQGSDNETAN